MNAQDCPAGALGQSVNSSPVKAYMGQVGPPPPALPLCASKRSCAQLHMDYGGWTGDTSFNQVSKPAHISLALRHLHSD